MLFHASGYALSNNTEKIYFYCRVSDFMDDGISERLIAFEIRRLFYVVLLFSLFSLSIFNLFFFWFLILCLERWKGT